MLGRLLDVPLFVCFGGITMRSSGVVVVCSCFVVIVFWHDAMFSIPVAHAG